MKYLFEAWRIRMSVHRVICICSTREALLMETIIACHCSTFLRKCSATENFAWVGVPITMQKNHNHLHFLYAEPGFLYIFFYWFVGEVWPDGLFWRLIITSHVSVISWFWLLAVKQEAWGFDASHHSSKTNDHKFTSALLCFRWVRVYMPSCLYISIQCTWKSPIGQRSRFSNVYWLHPTS